MYDCGITLIHLLQHVQVPELFTRTCHLIRRHVEDFPFARLLLKALLALSRKLAVDLPEVAMECYEGLGAEALSDVPISFVLPRMVEGEQPVADDSDESEGSEDMQMGKLLEKWNALSVQ